MTDKKYEYAVRAVVADGYEHIMPLSVSDDELALRLARSYSPGGERFKDAIENNENIVSYEVIQREVGEWEPFNDTQ